MSEKDLIVEEDGSVTEETKPVTTDQDTSKKEDEFEKVCML